MREVLHTIGKLCMQPFLRYFSNWIFLFLRRDLLIATTENFPTPSCPVQRIFLSQTNHDHIFLNSTHMPSPWSLVPVDLRIPCHVRYSFLILPSDDALNQKGNIFPAISRLNFPAVSNVQRCHESSLVERLSHKRSLFDFAGILLARFNARHISPPITSCLRLFFISIPESPLLRTTDSPYRFSDPLHLLAFQWNCISIFPIAYSHGQCVLLPLTFIPLLSIAYRRLSKFTARVDTFACKMRPPNSP